EPDNAKAKAMLPQMEKQDPGKALVTTLAVEREINTFFRLTSPSVIRRLRDAFPDLPDNPDPKAVFLKLRELRTNGEPHPPVNAMPGLLVEAGHVVPVVVFAEF